MHLFIPTKCRVHVHRGPPSTSGEFHGNCSMGGAAGNVSTFHLMLFAILSPTSSSEGTTDILPCLSVELRRVWTNLILAAGNQQPSTCSLLQPEWCGVMSSEMQPRCPAPLNLAADFVDSSPPASALWNEAALSAPFSTDWQPIASCGPVSKSDRIHRPHVGRTCQRSLVWQNQQLWNDFSTTAAFI